MILLKTINAMEKILPTVTPQLDSTFGKAFTNEMHAFQIAIFNDARENCKRMKLKVFGKLAKDTTFSTVELVPASRTAIDVDDYYLTTEPCLMPDLLKPIGKMGICVAPKQWKSVWVCVQNKNGLKVGKHSLKFVLYDENGVQQGEVLYTLEVLPSFLPKSDIKITNWMHYDCISSLHKVKLFSESFYKIFDKYLRAYTECGNNMLLTPLFTSPLDTLVGGERKTAQLVKVYKYDGEYTFSFEELKKFIFFVLDRGIEYIEFSHLFTQWGGEYCPKIVAETDAGVKKLFGWETPSNSSEYERFLSSFLPALVTELEKWGVKDRCCFHLTDEPHANHLENYANCRARVKKHIKRMPILDALSDYSFFEKGLVDMPVVCTNRYRAFIDNKTKNIFAYYCCVPSNEYYSNRLLHMPLLRARIIGFQLYANESKGFLHWGFNFYNTAYSLETVNPYSDTSAGGLFPAGDSFVVYPTKKGVLRTMRSETLCVAFQDYRLCKLVENKIGKVKTLEILKESGINGFNEYPRSEIVYEQIRDKLIAMLD